MPATNSRSERRSVQLAELNLLLAAVRGSPNLRSAAQKVEWRRLEPFPSSSESRENR